MNKHIEALKMAIEKWKWIFESERTQNHAETIYWLHQYKLAFANISELVKEALAEAEKQEIGEEEIRQMLKDIEYYQKRVEELEQPAQSACEECMGFNKQLADENDSLKSRIAELQRYAETMVNRPTNPATWQSLSDDEMKIIQNNSWIINDDGSKEFNTFVFARAIEAKVKEKNHG